MARLTLLKLSCIVNHTFAERTVILSSVIGSVDEDSFVREWMIQYEYIIYDKLYSSIDGIMCGEYA
jgi:hypothetical protein